MKYTVMTHTLNWNKNMLLSYPMASLKTPLSKELT